MIIQPEELAELERLRTENAQLQEALTSRIIIEQAKGVLAERGSLGMDAAFDRLRGYSRRHNLKLSDVGQQIIESDLAAAVLADRSSREATPRLP